MTEDEDGSEPFQFPDHCQLCGASVENQAPGLGYVLGGILSVPNRRRRHLDGMHVRCLLQEASGRGVGPIGSSPAERGSAMRRSPDGPRMIARLAGLSIDTSVGGRRL